MDSKIPDREKIENKPDFGKIFREMAEKKNIPKNQQERIAEQKGWNSLDVIEINEELFAKDNKENIKFNQKHRAYDESSIKELLEYQQKHKLNNTEMMSLFKISRNTIARWKRIFCEKEFVKNNNNEKL